MFTARHILLSASFALLPFAPAFAPRADQLAFGPKDDTTVSRDLAVEMAFYVDDLRVLVDGQEMPVPMDEPGFVFELALEVADRFVSSNGGRPIELVRTYQKVSLRGGPEGEAEAMDDMDKIVDKPIRFRWDEEDEEYDVSYADESARGDLDLLEGLDVDMDYRLLLPDREVSKGDTWTVRGPEIAWIFLPGGLPGGPEDDDDVWPLIEEAVGAQFEQAFRDFEVACTYQGTRTEGDTEVGEITFRFDNKASIDLGEVINAVISAQEVQIDLDIQAILGLEFDGTGALLWNLVAQHAHSMNMSTEMVVTLEAEADISMMGEQTSGEFSLEASGNGTWRMTTR